MNAKNLLTALLAILPLLGIFGCSKSAPPPASVTLNQTTWQVEIAMTNKDRYQGLSGRTELADGRGMLFIYPKSDLRIFCMRDCEFPIDIAFLDRQQRVISMHTMTVEEDRRGSIGYSSIGAAQYALEVPGGALGKAGVKLGDKAFFSKSVPNAAKAESGP